MTLTKWKVLPHCFIHLSIIVGWEQQYKLSEAGGEQLLKVPVLNLIYHFVYWQLDILGISNLILPVKVSIWLFSCLWENNYCRNGLVILISTNLCFIYLGTEFLVDKWWHLLDLILKEQSCLCVKVNFFVLLY
jgi:hypothetical protein